MPNFRINNTDRTRIYEKDILLEVKYAGEVPKSFKTIIDLDSYNLLPTSKVKIEAWCKEGNSAQTFNLGTVNAFSNPAEFELTEIRYKDPIRFNLKIVRENGMLDGLIDDIKGTTIDIDTGIKKDIDKIGFLEIDWSGDHYEPWRIICDYENSITPGISFSKHIQDAKNNFAEIFPLLNLGLFYKEILFQALDYYEFDPNKYDPQGDEAASKVIAFAETFKKWPEDLSSEDTKGFKKWIDNVSEEFCKSHEMTQQLNELNDRRHQ